MRWSERRPCAIFVGRISPEKGLRTLLRAWKAWGPQAPDLDVVGAGPDLEEERAFVAVEGFNAKVRFYGALPYEETQRLLASSRLLIVPSSVFEGYPMVVCEAFAHGVPVAVSDMGSLRALASPGVNGLRFTPGDPQDLRRVVRSAWDDGTVLARLSEGATETYRRILAPSPNLAALNSIYESATRIRRARFAE